MPSCPIRLKRVKRENSNVDIFRLFLPITLHFIQTLFLAILIFGSLIHVLQKYFLWSFFNFVLQFQVLRNMDNKLFSHLFLWISYGQLVRSNIMNDNFICISGFRLTDTPILDINVTARNGSVVKCFAHCLRMENCKSVSVNKDSSLCRLYDVSIAAIGSSPVQDVHWDTFTYKGWLRFFFR